MGELVTGSRFSTGWITKRWVELRFNPPYATAVYSVLLEKHKYFVLQMKDSRKTMGKSDWIPFPYQVWDKLSTGWNGMRWA